jgi:1,4-dihydroxy-2-naphthoate octaprenyltransferase
MGGFLAARSNQLDWMVLTLAILTTVLLQLLSNLANDLGDYENGADHEKREGPGRMVQGGYISPEAMRKAIVITAILSFISGILLLLSSRVVWQVFLVYLAVGILAIWAAIRYTLGKNAYGYRAMGDISVFLFFGWVGVIGTYYLQTGKFHPAHLLPASSCSFFAVAVLNINNIRDIASDQVAGKRTLAVVLGQRGSRVYHILLLTGGLVTASLYTWFYGGQWWFLLVVPLMIYNVYKVLMQKSVSLDPLVREMAIISLIFVLLFGIGML